MLPLRVEPPTIEVANDARRGRPDPDLFVPALAPLGGRRSRRVLRRGGCGSLRGDAYRERRVCGASLGRPTRSLRSLKGYPSSVHDRLRGTVLLCRCGSRSAASRSLRGPTIMGARPGILARRSGDKPLRSFVAAGQGLALYEGPSRVKGWVWLLISLSHPRCGVIRRDRSCPGGVSHTRTLAGVRASRRLPGRTAACG